jgi:hypothetical protein
VQVRVPVEPESVDVLVNAHSLRDANGDRREERDGHEKDSDAGMGQFYKEKRGTSNEWGAIAEMGKRWTVLACG